MFIWDTHHHWCRNFGCRASNRLILTHDGVYIWRQAINPTHFRECNHSLLFRVQTNSLTTSTKQAATPPSKMSAVYDITRIVLLIFSGVLFVIGLVEFIQLLVDKSNDVALIVSMILTTLLQLLGAYASYHHIRSYLILYALILLIMTILALTSHTVLYYHLSSAAGIFLIILALVQADLSRRGFH